MRRPARPRSAAWSTMRERCANFRFWALVSFSPNGTRPALPSATSSGRRPVPRIGLVDLLDPALELGLGDLVAVRVALVDLVPHADEGHAAPRDQEEVAAAAREHGVGVPGAGGHGEREVTRDQGPLHDEVGVAGERRRGPQPFPQRSGQHPLGVGAGGVEDDAGLDLEDVAGYVRSRTRTARTRPSRTASPTASAWLAQTAPSAAALWTKARTRRVGLYICPSQKTPPPVSPSAGRPGKRRMTSSRERKLASRDAARRVGDAAVPASGERVVERHAGAQHRLALHAGAVGRDHDRQRVREVRGDAQEGGACRGRLPDARDVDVLQVADAAMQHLEGVGRGGAAEVARSTSATLRPRCAASSAAAAPNIPPPMTARSNGPRVSASRSRCMAGTGACVLRPAPWRPPPASWSGPSRPCRRG